MGKTESVRRFGDFTCINSWYRNASGTTEKSEILRNGSCEAVGTYHRINRPRQCYDYEMSLDDALCNLLDSISWKYYEAWKEDIDKIKDALKTMENYGGTPRN